MAEGNRHIRFKPGDRVKVVNPASWCNGCTGIIKSDASLTIGAETYCVRLDRSPSAHIKDVFIKAEWLVKEGGA